MANEVSVPHGIRLIRPFPALEPFVRYYGHRDARLSDTIVVHPVHARAAPILDFEFGAANFTSAARSTASPSCSSPSALGLLFAEPGAGRPSTVRFGPLSD
jgi:hypothetical protein